MCGCRKNLAAPASRAAPAPAPRPAPAPAPAPRPAPAPAPRPAPRPAPAPRPVPAPRAAPARNRSSLLGVMRGRTHVIAQPITRHGLPIQDTSVWGAKLWRVIHTVIERTPGAAQALVAALKTSLPCPDCDNHYNQWLAKTPFHGDARTWFLNLHNNVNVRTGKSTWTAEQVAAEYSTEASIVAARAILEELSAIIGADAVTVLRGSLA